MPAPVRTTRSAPIALFVYNRPAHVRRAIEALRGADGFDPGLVHVFADGPRPGDEGAAAEARQTARDLLGDAATYHEREANAGVDRSIVEGVTAMCDRFGRVIVVEDDLVVEPGFLAFLNAGLERFEDEPSVMQVCGHMFDAPSLAATNEAVLLPLTSAWGWATWSRAWRQFDPAASGWRERFADPAARERFDLGGAYPFVAMLSRQMARPEPAWDIRWYYSVFARGGLALYPPRSLVYNAGFDGSGVHHRASVPIRQAVPGAEPAATAFALPDRVAESAAKDAVFQAIAASRRAGPVARARAVAGYVRRRVSVAR